MFKYREEWQDFEFVEGQCKEDEPSQEEKDYPFAWFYQGLSCRLIRGKQHESKSDEWIIVASKLHYWSLE